MLQVIHYVTICSYVFYTLSLYIYLYINLFFILPFFVWWIKAVCVVILVNFFDVVIFCRVKTNIRATKSFSARFLYSSCLACSYTLSMTSHSIAFLERYRRVPCRRFNLKTLLTSISTLGCPTHLRPTAWSTKCCENETITIEKRQCPAIYIPSPSGCLCKSSYFIETA